MILNRYDLEVNADYLTFEFFSEGPRGSIKKVIRFEKINPFADIYNLGFGDFDEATNTINDVVVSNNKDLDRIVATIAMAFIQFNHQYPTAWVVMRGSTPSRTRLYSRQITKNLFTIKYKFELWGTFDGNTWQPFEANKRYNSLLIRKK